MGDVVEVVVGEELAISSSTLPAYFDFGTSYQVVWTTSHDTRVDIVSSTNGGAIVEGIGAGAATITAEIKQIVGGDLVAFDPAIKDTIVITAVTGD